MPISQHRVIALLREMRHALNAHDALRARLTAVAAQIGREAVSCRDPEARASLAAMSELLTQTAVQSALPTFPRFLLETYHFQRNARRNEAKARAAARARNAQQAREVPGTEAFAPQSGPATYPNSIEAPQEDLAAFADNLTDEALGQPFGQPFGEPGDAGPGSAPSLTAPEWIDPRFIAAAQGDRELARQLRDDDERYGTLSGPKKPGALAPREA